MTAGQMVSGKESTGAVGNTTLTEGLVCLVGFLAYLATQGGVEWKLAVPLTLGAVASTPLSAWTTRRLGAKRLTVILGVVILPLGIATLVTAAYR